MTKQNKLNDLISGELKRQKITQNEAGYYIGLTQSQFSNRIRGKSKWKLNEIIGLSELLGIGGEIGEILFK